MSGSFFLAFLLEPSVVLFCWVFAPMIGAYRVAIPFCGILAGSILVGGTGALSDQVGIFIAPALFLFGFLVGATHAVLSILVWKAVPDRFKDYMVSK